MTLWGGQVHRVLSGLRRHWSAYQELRERAWLMQRPWQEEVLHWGADGHLHGHLAPAPGARNDSTTSDGWCPGLRSRHEHPSTG